MIRRDAEATETVGGGPEMMRGLPLPLPLPCRGEGTDTPIIVVVPTLTGATDDVDDNVVFDVDVDAIGMIRAAFGCGCFFVCFDGCSCRC